MNDEKSKQPFFSVIIPTYNRAKLLPIAINSVLAQIYTNFELIIVDDGSIDDTQNIVKGFEDNRIRYFWQENTGNEGSRNTGLKEAQGRYICFLDSDDYYLENHLAVLYERIKEEAFPIAIFRTGMYIQNTKGVQTPTILYNKQKHQTPFLFFWHYYTGINSLCLAKEITDLYQFPSQFLVNLDGLFEGIVSCKYPLVQLKKYTCVAVHHEKNMSLNYDDYNKITIQLNSHLDGLNWLRTHPDIIFKKVMSVELYETKIAFVRLVYAYKYISIGAKDKAIEQLKVNGIRFLFDKKLLKTTIGVWRKLLLG